MPRGVRSTVAVLLLLAGVLGPSGCAAGEAEGVADSGAAGIDALKDAVKYAVKDAEKEERAMRVFEERVPGPAAGSAAAEAGAYTGVGVGSDAGAGTEVGADADIDADVGAGAAVDGRAAATVGVNRLGSAEVPVRVYEPAGEAPWATLVWAHGGSFVRGTLDWPEADWAARSFAEAGLRVYSVDYALASETVKAPAPSNDVAAVLREVAARHAGPMFAGGASAGAHLAALAALQQAEFTAAGAAASAAGGSTGESRAQPRAVDAIIMLYPTAHRVQRVDPALAAATAALPDARSFSAGRIAEMYDFYLGAGGSLRAESDLGAEGNGEGGGADPLAYSTVPRVLGELPQSRLSLLPPVVVVNADLDDLRASGEQFAEQLRAAGVAVSESVQPGTVHGYLNRPDESARATADARATIDRFVAELRAAVADA